VKCPYCGDSKNGVVDSRDADDQHAVRRRRVCYACDRRFTTYERIEEMPILIVKKDGRRQTFSRQKLIAGLRRACEKRPIPAGMVDAAGTQIERSALDLGEREIAAQWVGEQAMAALRKLDEVAYVRYASVYRSFRDVEEFARELELLRKKGSHTGAQEHV
jgi:transcriptional repressor NrdR